MAEAAPVYEHLRAWRRQTREKRGRPTLEVELHRGWHHGWLCLVPAAQRRLIAPTEVGEVLQWLTDPGNRAVTGQVISVDGGELS